VSFAQLNSLYYQNPYLQFEPDVNLLQPINVPPLSGGDKKIRNIKVGLVTGANFSSQSLSTSGAELDKYKALRVANESPGLGPNIGLILKGNVKSITISSGLSYTSRRQRLNEQNEFTYQLYDSIPVLNPQSDTIGFLPFNYRDTTTTDQISRPTYNYVTIPIAIGKEFYFGNKWSLETTINSNFGYLVSAKGSSLKSNAGLQILNAGGLNRLLIDVGVGLGANYKINDKWTANMTGRLNRDLTNAIKSQNISQKMTTYGLGIGIFYSLK
jgi:hypothetical protein